MTRIILILCLWCAVSVDAAIKYIRAGASGSNNGSDWVNAYTDIGSLTRGSTNYVADGSYSAFDFSDSPNGNVLAVLKKASTNDHGTDTGWTNTYGTGTATLQPNNIIDSGYFTWDGSYKWGFKVVVADTDRGVDLNSGTSSTNVIIRFVEVAGPDTGNGYPWTAETYGMYLCTFGGYLVNWTIENCYIHGTDTMLQTANTISPIIQSNILAQSDRSAPSTVHPNVWYAQHVTDVTFRWNTVSNFAATGFYPNGNSPGTHRIYGNWFDQATSGGGAIWIFANISQGTWLIHDNTFHNTPQAIYQDAGASITGSSSNNIFYGFSRANNFSGLTHDYNWYSGGSAYSEAHGIAAGATNPFLIVPGIVTNVGASYPAGKGADLGNQFDKDFAGNTHGKDGAWDIGAMEAVGSTTNPPTVYAPRSIIANTFYSGAPAPTNEPAGRWMLNEGSGSVSVADSSGYGHTGYLSNSVVWTNGPGSVPYSLYFDGTNKVYCGIIDSSTNNAVTMTGWSRVDSTNFQFTVTHGGQAIIAWPLPGGTNWYFLVFKINVDCISAYTNGVKVGFWDTCTGVNYVGGIEPVIFGGGGAGNTGSMSDMRMYRRALSDSEILSIYNAGPGGN